MPIIDIAAIAGAAAWLPQIISWIYKSSLVPKISIVPGRTAQISYTSLGPIFNLNLAFSSDKKEVIIDKIEINMKHEDGDTHNFLWQMLDENMGEISNIFGDKAYLKKAQPAIALKITTVSLVERFVLFQEPKFHEEHKSPFKDFEKVFEFYKEKENTDTKKSISSKEFYSLVKFFESYFWWKKGKYTIEFKVNSLKKAKLLQNKYYFELSAYDVKNFKSNIDKVKVLYEDFVRAITENRDIKKIDWHWNEVNLTQV